MGLNLPSKREGLSQLSKPLLDCLDEVYLLIHGDVAVAFDTHQEQLSDLDRRVAAFNEPTRSVEPQSCVDDDGTFEMPREEWEAAKAMETERDEALKERDDLRAKLQGLHRDIEGICENIPLTLADAFTEALKRFPVEGPAPGLVWRDECVAKEDGIYLFRDKDADFYQTGGGGFFKKGDWVCGEGSCRSMIAGPIPEPREPDDVKELTHD